MLRGKSFWSSSLGQQQFKSLELLVELFWSLQVYRKTRLKNSKRTSKCQFTVLEKPKKWTEWHAKEKKNFRKKISQCRKKLKGGIFQHLFCRKKSNKKLKGDPLGNFPKKRRNAEKNWKKGPFGLARYSMLRGKTRKTFLVHFARPNSAICCNNIL